MIERLSGVCAGLRRRGALLAIAALPALLLAACAPRQPYPLPPPSNIPFNQGRIWQVEGADIQTSYVFGTMHVDDKKVMELPPAVETAFGAAQVVALEVAGDLDDWDKEAYRERLKLPEGQTLEDLIGKRSFGILTWHMKRSMMRPKNNIKPWVFWQYMGGQSWGFIDYDYLEPSGHEMVLDAWLEHRAKNDGKRVAGLETGEEHFDIYDKIPLEQQVDLLKLTLDQYSDNKPHVPKLKLYLDGELGIFDALWREYLSWLPPETAQTIDRRLIVDRNRIMVERMLPLMRDEIAFVAVGAAHMAGEEGILNLLQQRGYTVTRLH